MAANRKSVVVTAPDYGAVFDILSKCIAEACDSIAFDEAEGYWWYIKGYIESNRAQPEGPVFEAGGQVKRTRMQRRVPFPRTWTAVRPVNVRNRYQRRKIAEGYGNTHLIRTGSYRDNIRVLPPPFPEKGVAEYKVGFRPASRNDNGFPFIKLAKILEFGLVRPVRRTRTRGGKTEKVTTLFMRQAARPHWRPAHLWYANKRMKGVPRRFLNHLMGMLEKKLALSKR